MSRLKEVSSSNHDAITALQGLSDAHRVTPAEDADAFGGIVDMSAREDAAEEKGAEQENTDNPEMTTSGKEGKASSKAAHDNTIKGKEDQEGDGVQVSEEEKEAINDYQIDVAELARQLNISFDQLKKQLNPEGQTVIVVPQNRAAILSVKPADHVNSELLRKVDVETLRQQMELVMAQKEPVQWQTEVPQAVALDTVRNIQALAHLNGTKQDVTGPLNPELEALLQAKGIDLHEILMQAETQATAPVGEHQDAKAAGIFDHAAFGEATLVMKDNPDVVMDVVAIDLNRLSEQGQKKPDFILIPVDELGPGQLIDDKNTSLIDLFTTTVKGHGSVENPQQFVLLNPLSPAHDTAMAVNIAHLLPLREKVADVVLQMSRLGKSGTTKIQIYPPELGAVNIKISMQNDKVKVEITTEQQATRACLEGHVAHFKGILQAEKLDVTSFEVNFDKDFFNEGLRGILTPTGWEQGQRFGEGRGFYDNDTLKEEIEKLKELIAENVRRGVGGNKKIDVMA